MKDLDNLANWKYKSPEKEGFYEIVIPENSDCKITWTFRLNLNKDSKYDLCHQILELNCVVIKGKIYAGHSNQQQELDKFDSFYLHAKEIIKITAKEDCSIFSGGSYYEKVISEISWVASAILCDLVEEAL
jgi:5-deoxy-glucuronate isomerase